MQHQHLEVPIPRSIWKEIVLDRYVNFERLHASVGFDHNDTPK
jgi:hypothetical protein